MKALERNQTRAHKVVDRDGDELIGEFGPGCEHAVELDSGADRTFIPRSLLDKIRSRDANVEMTIRPINVQFATKDDREKPNVNGFIEVPVTIGTSAAEITLLRVKCWVMEAEMETVLIGQPELGYLGIDPMTALERLIETKSASNTIEDYATAKKLSGQEPAGEEIEEIKGKIDDEELKTAKEEMIGRALEQGADETIQSKLHSIVESVPELFRVRLGADPPAKVRPMQIHLKPNARPRRCKPRRYPSSHSDFLREFVKQLETNGYIYRNIKSRYTSPVLVVRSRVTEAIV